MKLSVCLITLNEESNLRRCLASVARVADEMVLVDSGSTDRTLEIATEFGARVISQPWLGYVGQKNFTIDQAVHEWILSIDADEEVSPGLSAEMEALKSGARNVPPRCAGFRMARCVLYEGRWIRHGDWYPDRLVRLFRKDRARFAGAKVHERLELSGEVCDLRSELFHYSFKDRADHWQRCRSYARLWAESAFEAGKRAGPFAGSSHAAFRWVRGYLFRGGFLDGAQGWHIARMSAVEVRLKYALLRKMGQNSGRF